MKGKIEMFTCNVYVDTFNEKVNSFSDHSRYEDFRKYADKALLAYTGYGWEAIAYEDFIDRIVAMPLDYIRDWLDGKNELKWRKQDEKMLEAVKGGFVDVLEKYPEAEIHHIAESAIHFYKECGFEIVEDDKDYTLNGKDYHSHRVLAIKGVMMNE